MPGTDKKQSRQNTSDIASILEYALTLDDPRHAALLLRDRHPAEIADVMESLPPDERRQLWLLIDPAILGEVLVETHDEVRTQLIKATDPANLAQALAKLDLDALADIYDELPHEIVASVMRLMDVQRQRILQALRAYPEDTAGGLMDMDAIMVRGDVTLDAVHRYLRWLRRTRGVLPELTDTLIVVDRQSHYLGLLALSDMVSLDPELKVAEVMLQDVEGIPADMPARKVARLFADRDLVSAPVVDANDRLIGRITVDDMIDVIREEAEHSMLSAAGMSEETDMFAPIFSSAKRRAVWLGVNLINAFIAAWVIGLFGGTIEQLVALAILMPVVASMGGVAGNQTLALVIRGIALDQVGSGNARELLLKELGVGLANGALWALVVASVVAFWFGSLPLALIFGLAIVINLINGALIGTMIPFGLKRLGIDPALAGGVLLTALTDVVGFASFLGLASLFVV